VSEVLCPRCQADQPRMIAWFGSTACKALMICSSCGEPFDYFKQF
jgi:ring-1,2-phenylacetyl-CoA epoxidase subunit PaaD